MESRNNLSDTLKQLAVLTNSIYSLQTYNHKQPDVNNNEYDHDHDDLDGLVLGYTIPTLSLNTNNNNNNNSNNNNSNSNSNSSSSSSSSSSSRYNISSTSVISSAPFLIQNDNIKISITSPVINDNMDSSCINQISAFINDSINIISSSIEKLINNNNSINNNELFKTYKNVLSESERNNQTTREFHKLHENMAKERQDLLVSVSNTKSEILKEISNCEKIREEISNLKNCLLEQKNEILFLRHQNSILNFEIEKLKKICDKFKTSLKSSENREINLNKEKLKLQNLLLESELNLAELECQIEQLNIENNYIKQEKQEKQEKSEKQEKNEKQEKHEIHEKQEKQEKQESLKTNPKFRKFPYTVGMTKTDELLKDINEINNLIGNPDKTNQKISNLKLLLSEYEICRDAMFFLKSGQLDNLEEKATELVESSTNLESEIINS